jgi:proteic killer suppression protein
MIKTWKHKGLKVFFETGNTSKIQPKHKQTLREILFQLEHATCPQDMNTPGNRFHGLIGDKKSYFSVSVSGNWRVVFAFDGEDAILVDYLDYH